MPKPKVSAYSCFVEEYIKRTRGQGGNMSNKGAYILAGPAWNKLSVEERAKYEAMAQEAKMKDGRTQSDNRLDSMGNRVQDNLRKDMEAEQLMTNMGIDIRSLIQTLGSLEAVAKYKFLIISFNYYFKSNDGEYFPAEVGMIEYSVADGVMKSFHEFIEPGPLPTGATYSVMQHSDLTHKIPMGSFDDRTILKENFEDIFHFVSDMTQDFKTPIFCLPHELNQTRNIMETLYNIAASKTCIKPLVYDLSNLFCSLYNFASDKPFSDGIATDILSKDTFCYNLNIGCHYHDEVDAAKHCALGIVKRACFVMSDVLCNLYQVTPMPNAHLPVIDSKDASFGTMRSLDSIRLDSPRRPSSSTCGRFDGNSTTNGSSFLRSKSCFDQYSHNEEFEIVSMTNQSISNQSWKGGSPSEHSFSVDSGEFPVSGSSVCSRGDIATGPPRSSQGSVRSVQSSSRTPVQDNSPAFTTPVLGVSAGRGRGIGRGVEPKHYRGIGRGVKKE